MQKAQGGRRRKRFSRRPRKVIVTIDIIGNKLQPPLDRANWVRSSMTATRPSCYESED